MSNPQQVELGSIPDRFLDNIQSVVDNSNCDSETKQTLSEISSEVSKSLKDICLVVSQLHK